MCNKFVGSWKLISSENFDDYMKELGEIYLVDLNNVADYLLLISYQSFPIRS